MAEQKYMPFEYLKHVRAATEHTDTYLGAALPMRSIASRQHRIVPKLPFGRNPLSLQKSKSII